MRFVTDPCPEPQAFVFKNGARARSLAEFESTLAQVPSDVVQYHREHYHHWVRDILGDPGLAERVRAEGQRAHDGEQLRRSLERLVREAKPAAGGRTEARPSGRAPEPATRGAVGGAGRR